MKQFNLPPFCEHACKWAPEKLRRLTRDWSACWSLSPAFTLAQTHLLLIQNIRYYQCMKQFNPHPSPLSSALSLSLSLSHENVCKWVRGKLSGRSFCLLWGFSLCFCDQSICQRSDFLPEQLSASQTFPITVCKFINCKVITTLPSYFDLVYPIHALMQMRRK